MGEKIFCVYDYKITINSKKLISAQKLQGKVTSLSTNKTVIVTVNRLVKHPLYKKRSKVSKSYHAHLEDRNCNLGDEVELQPCRPISRCKRFLVSKVVRAASAK